MTSIKILLAAAVAAGLSIVTYGGAQAQVLEWERPKVGPPKSRVVYAESRWGHGTVSGPVRRGREGWEVRLPRGTWIPCKRSCSDTLRLATVDFWETQGRDAPDGGPGYLRFNFWF
jgi:hypothetical protein